ncbi:RelA/SpoT family protein [Janthinobacterium sp. 61]|uniref:RelA/SpoT domain-containing protein n=1 Tax=Janthinobacterium sp. 61 TaxID=2035209 RepID=UPI000C6FDD52|nr:RelA/SpoT domain-containing protein [Janthinobacterium sp. 61]PKV47786.1 RelA/SpoT family protein [Janthinobacterium sp. 61]
MSFPIPEFSRKQVQRAGYTLVNFEESEGDFDMDAWHDAFLVLTNWRACHGYPINTFQATLRNKLKKIDPDALVAQRLKRTPSIINKLQRIKGMNLARMQDIGGLRAVVNSLPQLQILHQEYKTTIFTHTLVSEYDYVKEPKESGYRSVHLIYRYKLRYDSPYDGLQLELQMRTKLQHAWATAVETMGTFLRHSLKSSEGPDEWLNFFALVSSAFAHSEKMPLVPGYEHLSKAETYRKTKVDSERLGVREKLERFSSAVRAIPTTGKKRAAYYLVELQLTGDDSNVKITSFARDKLEEANTQYSSAEREAKSTGTQVVLVAAGSIESLKRAYPNYFLDTHEFLTQLEKIARSKFSIVE